MRIFQIHNLLSLDHSKRGVSIALSAVRAYSVLAKSPILLTNGRRTSRTQQQTTPYSAERTLWQYTRTPAASNDRERSCVPGRGAFPLILCDEPGTSDALSSPKHHQSVTKPRISANQRHQTNVQTPANYGNTPK